MENDKNSKNIDLSMNELYEVLWGSTGRLYLEDTGRGKAKCHAFLDKASRDEFLESHEGTTGSPPHFSRMQELCSNCYAQGADVICVHGKKGDMELPLDDDRLPIRPYNHACKRMLALLVQTRQEKYLRKMPECEYIVPVRIENNPLSIKYCAIKNKDPNIGILFVAFSDFGEFMAWQASHGKKWEPLRVDYPALYRIARNSAGIVIDPGTAHATISRELLDGVGKDILLRGGQI